MNSSQSILEEISQNFDEKTLNAVSQQLGADTESTEDAIATILPVLLGGLSNNVQNSPDGVQALGSALEDNDGSLLNQFGGLGGIAGGIMAGQIIKHRQSIINMILGLITGKGNNKINPRSADGNSILNDILGNNREGVTKGITNSTNLNETQIRKLMMLLGPVLLSTLGKKQRQNNMSAQDMSDYINNERAAIERKLPSGIEGDLVSMFDANNDGEVNVQDAVAHIGKSLSKSLLGRG